MLAQARRHARRKKMETYSRSLWHAFSASVVAGIGHLIWVRLVGVLFCNRHAYLILAEP